MGYRRYIYGKRVVMYVAMLLSLAVMAVCITSYVKTERMFYFWDYFGYQEKLINICQGDASLGDRLKALRFSIQHDEYTDVGIYPLLPICRVFGTARLPYILSIYFLYGIPAIVALYITIRTYAARLFPSNAVTDFVLWTTVLFFPQTWAGVLVGFIDILGLICISIVLIVTIRKHLYELSFRDILLITLSLTALLVLRRWYAYWVVGYLGGLMIESTALYVIEQKHELVRFARAVYRVLGITVGIIFTLFAAGGDTLLKRFTVNYAAHYYPWKFESSMTEIMNGFIGKFGLVSTILFIAGIIFLGSMYYKKSRILFLVSSFLITFLLFHSVQSYSPQHLYLILPVILVVVSVFMGYVFSRLGILMARIAVFLFVCIVGLNIFWVFGPVDGRLFGPVSVLFSKDRFPPIVRHDFDAMKALLYTTQDLYLQQEGRITPVASSHELNAHLLWYACGYFHLETSFCNAIYLYSGVDVNGFPDELFRSRYLLVAEPAQYHLSPKDHRILGRVVEELKNNNTLGIYYRVLPQQFYLDNGVTVTIYIQNAGIPESTINTLFGDHGK